MAYDHEEYVMGVCAVATPVRDAVGAVGALTVEVPANRFSGARGRARARRAAQRDLAHRALVGAGRRSETRLPAATFRHADA